ncbi:MAG: 4-hydroxythreonine-4-phosphate dehydrogenase PdxA, partial [Bacteroidetes bacterium]|nr:4-hydroxythreonine-4-phosphate dehydrogenase PdxA [Bacteroidota bacterium]
MSNFIFTCGDVNGIGPEIVIKSLNNLYNSKKHSFIFATPLNVFNSIIKNIQPNFSYNIVESISDKFDNRVTILKLPDTEIEYGNITSKSGLSAYNSIKIAFNLLREKKVDAMLTAPISKTALSIAGINYPGHTEMLADWCNVDDCAMVFLSDKMKSALVTIHSSIKNITKEITITKLTSSFEIIIRTLQNDFLINEPKIAVLGLNPHAGENGLIGREEKEIIIPSINSSKYKKYLFGPFSPDAFFAKHNYKDFDLVLGMYHDQVLIPFKMLNSGKGVNFTAGLPIVRTSP